jgi:hypothetical protein
VPVNQSFGSQLVVTSHFTLSRDHDLNSILYTRNEVQASNLMTLKLLIPLVNVVRHIDALETIKSGIGVGLFPVVILISSREGTNRPSDR